MTTIARAAFAALLASACSAFAESSVGGRITTDAIPQTRGGLTIVETYTTGTAKIIDLVEDPADVPTTVVRRPPVPCGGFGILSRSGAQERVCISGGGQ